MCDVVPRSTDERSIVESYCSWLSGSKVIQAGSCKELLPSAASYLPITKKTLYNFSLLLTLDGPLCRNWTAVIQLHLLRLFTDKMEFHNCGIPLEGTLR